MLKKRNKYIFFLAFVLSPLLLGSAGMHKFYVSHYSLYYEKGSYAMMAKIFTDDLEKALQKKDPGLRFIKGLSPAKTDSVLFGYFRNTLHLETDEKNLEPVWVGKEYENDLTWIYMRFPAGAEHKMLKVSCSALTEIFDDQVNLFNIRHTASPETFMLTKKEQEKSLDFSK